jgi:hypothetical protein
MEVCLLSRNVAGGTEVAAFLRMIGQDLSEWCGVAFSPDGTRMYLSSQRGTDGRGITYEITGPFRTSATPVPVTETLVAAGSVWRFWDRGAEPAAGWRGSGFDDGAWGSGAAPLGYGDPMSTVVGYGPDGANKYMTTYFRRSFSVSHGYASLSLSLRRDDGAVVYVNGVEVARSNMPSGPVTFSTRASVAVAGADETTFQVMLVSAPLVSGVNVVAVEVHQVTGSSTDLGFDLVLTGTGDTGPLQPTTTTTTTTTTTQPPTTAPPTTAPPTTAPPTTAPPTTAPPTTTTVAVVTSVVTVAHDAHTRDGKYATTNYGSMARAEVQKSTSGNNRMLFVKLDTSGHAAGVRRAVLRLWVASTKAAAANLDVRAVASTTWVQSTLTWSTMPTVGTTLATVSVGGTSYRWMEVDVTSHVAAERAQGRSLVSFAVVQATSGPLNYVSTSEAVAAQRPQLVLSS